MIGADLNGHVREGNRGGDEDVIGGHRFGTRSPEGQAIMDVAKRLDLVVVNTFFGKKEEHRVTYKSGSRSTQINYVLCKRRQLKEVGDCKVIPGEGVAKQHRLLVVRMTFQVKAENRTRTKPKIKWCKLKEKEFRDKLQQEVEESCGRGNHCWKSGRTQRAV